MSRTTLVLGASPKPERYSHAAVRRLVAQGHSVVAIGRRPGSIGAVPIVTALPPGIVIDTVTLYLSAAHQAEWEDVLLALRPRRVIFNPGAEHPAFAVALRAKGVEALEACTLVMLATGQY